MPKYFEFEVSLKDIRPRIWRRFLLREAATFRELHDGIQAAGPWQDSHLWEFCTVDRRKVIAGVLYDDAPRPIPDAKRIKVGSSLTAPGKKCLYRYDFGDDWEHEVVLRQVVELADAFRGRLLAGRRAFPPEDCGGVPGYYECLAAVGAYSFPANSEGAPSAADLAERREWLGKWTPDFDLAAAKKEFDH